MSRNLLFACFLLGAAVLATAWALSPFCQGRFCFGPAAKTGVERVTADAIPGQGREGAGEGATVPASDAPAPAAETAGGAPAASLAAPEPAGTRQDQGPGAADPDLVDPDEDIDAFERPKPSLEQRRAQKAAEAKAAERWKSLVDAALNEPDDELRAEAINGVGLHRNADSVAVLNEVAAFDPAPDNRLQAVQQLWYSAADGLDSDGSIESTLRAALDDPSEAVVKMAEKALADLEALEKSRLAD